MMNSMLSRSGPEYSISWVRCFLLCVPALLIGCYFRAELLQTLPYAFFGADSGSYAHTMHKLWLEGGLSIQEKRRWLYPLFLVPLPLSPFSVLGTLAFIQHMLGLAATVALAWIVGHVTRLSIIWIPLVTSLYAVWPRILWYEHEVIAEGIFLPAFLLATALAFPLSRLTWALPKEKGDSFSKNQGAIFCFLLAIGSLALLKPHGKVLWLVMLGALFLLNRRPLLWGIRSWAAIIVTCLLVVTSGSASQGSWLLLSSTLPLVPRQGAYLEYRDILQPLIQEARADLSNYVFIQTKYKKLLNHTGSDDGSLGVEWEKLVRDEHRFKRVASSLALSAMTASPLAYSRLVVEKILCAASDCRPPQKFRPRIFWQEQVQVKHLLRDPQKIPFLFGMSKAGMDMCVANSLSQEFLSYRILERVASLCTWSTAVQGSPGNAPFFRLRWMGWLALAGFVLCLVPSHFLPTLLLWAPSLSYLLVCYGIGDDVRRYLQPVEWVGWLLGVRFLDWVLLRVQKMILFIFRHLGYIPEKEATSQ